MILFCLGMPSSGSTWLYNIVREILTAARVEHVALRGENYDNFLDHRLVEAKNAVLRGHNIESLLLRVFKLADVKAVLSFRDPRDAIASFLQRFGDFGASLPRCCNDAMRSLAALASASQHLDHCAFYYEDGFTANPGAIHRLADFLGYPLSEDQVATIFAKYRPEAVREFTATIDTLPEERLFVDGTNNTMDRVTSFHRTHMSDMRVGKWRDFFDNDTQVALSEAFGDYVRALSERASGLGRASRHNRAFKALSPVSIRFASSLFAPVDDLNRFTRYLTSAEVYSELGIRILDYLYLPEGNWSFTIQAQDLSGFTVRFCQNGEIRQEVSTENQIAATEFQIMLHDHPVDIHITYERMTEDMSTGAHPPRVLLDAVRCDVVPDHSPAAAVPQSIA